MWQTVLVMKNYHHRERVKQSIPKHLRYTVNHFNEQFPDENACLEWLKEQRFPGGMAHCEKCDKDRKHHRVTGRPAYACDYCGSMVSPMAGTIFHKSPTPLRLWFYAMYLMSATRCGISAKQIQRETGVTYKTAWRMFKQIRTLMSEDVSLEGEAVEIDETYVGGKGKNKKLGKRTGTRGRTDDKTPVFGMVERGGSVIAKVTPDVKARTLYPIIHERVLPASIVFSDEYAVYDRLGETPHQYDHRRISHAEKVYVMGDIHTNTIEGFWSLLKRGIGGVYHQISAKHLQMYCDEYAYRYNRRFSDKPMFTSLLDEVAKRVN
jgi:transposase-like protein